MTLEELSARQRAFSDARAWGPFHTPKNLVMALSGEVGELTELFQWLTPDEATAAPDDPATRARIEDELADVLLYLVRLADVLGVDLLAAGHAKIDRNEVRFPAGVGKGALDKVERDS
ncbi:nucleotide pyrophosphohydrolase [Actinokineospora auranticolor]|uniref:nucleotide pyrophosphohydrolase n=1 Tax=Actinokineospora auranticolor TaxID=155976 RepID=UPI000CEBE8BC|nr:nucleotide pyrophosphohydrolase [Actinokineospora auranticolor]